MGCKGVRELASEARDPEPSRSANEPPVTRSEVGAGTASVRVSRDHSPAVTYMASDIHSRECGNGSTHQNASVNGARIDTPITNRDSHQVGSRAASAIVQTRYQDHRWAMPTNEIVLIRASDAFTMVSGVGCLNSATK